MTALTQEQLGENNPIYSAIRLPRGQEVHAAIQLTPWPEAWFYTLCGMDEWMSWVNSTARWSATKDPVTCKRCLKAKGRTMTEERHYGR